MNVVHTITQLEEARSLGAKEILVTGKFASSVRDVFLSESTNVNNSCLAETFSLNDMSKLEHIAEKSEITVCQVASIMAVIGDYCLLDTSLDAQSPCMLIKK